MLLLLAELAGLAGGLVVVGMAAELAEKGAVSRRLRTLAGWRGAVNELLEKVDQKVREKHEGRDPGQGARPKETTSCVVYAPPPK